MLFYRVLKILGCNHGCHESQRPPGGIGGVGVQVPISSVETLRNRHSDPKSIIPFGNPANSEYFQRLFMVTNLAIKGGFFSESVIHFSDLQISKKKKYSKKLS